MPDAGPIVGRSRRPAPARRRCPAASRAVLACLCVACAATGADGSADARSGSAWGWISVLEWNDTCDQWYLKTPWFGGIRAYFADEPEWNRALPHTLGWCTARATAGACTLYDPALMSKKCAATELCPCLDRSVECDETPVRWCPEDQVCVASSGSLGGRCRNLPRHYDAGTVTITGLKVPVTMVPDAMDRYHFPNPPDPDDLFDAGDAITATTTGGLLPPLQFTARGVAPLVVEDPTVHLRVGSGQPAVVRWTPADPASRVQVALMGGSHDPNPLAAAILCDVPDGDGQVEVAASLLDEFHRLSCDGAWLSKCSRITRYGRDLQDLAGREVELFVGSARNLQIVVE